MRGAVVLGLFGLVALLACSDNGLTPAPGPIAAPTSSSSSSGGPRDSGGDDDDGGTTEPPPTPEGWGDPKTTRVPGKLRLAQLNVRRFFDTKCDSGTCSANGFETQATQDAFDKRVAQLATALATLQADIVTLAEVENQICLDAVKKSLGDAGFPYPVAYVAETGYPGSVDVAILARGKLGTVKNYQDTTSLVPYGSNLKFTREFPEIHLTLGNSQVVVFAAHFKSKAPPDDPVRRLAEAKAAHDIMKATGDANKDALVLLGGDLNDTPGSDPINALEAGGDLFRVASDLPAAAQGTIFFQKMDLAIDHIFVTKNHKDAYVAKSAKVERDSKTGFAGSDHATLHADFTLP